MTDEAPQWITEINPGIQEAPLLSRDLVHPVAQGIHVVTVAHQGLQMMGASQDQFIHHNSSGDLTKEDHLQDFLKVREIIIITFSPLTLIIIVTTTVLFMFLLDSLLCNHHSLLHCQ